MALLGFRMKVTPGIKKAVKLRLELLLAEEKKRQDWWHENVKEKMNATRRAQVDRIFRKRITALRIVIWMLTPGMERDRDVPNLF